MLAAVDLQSGIRLVRAFSAYFRLADVAQRVHLVDSLALRRALLLTVNGVAAGLRNTG